jgi:hypothetical protein
MKPDRATLHILATFPEVYLQSEDVLFVEVNNMAAEAVTVAEFRTLLNELETQRLVVSQRVQGRVKWKITGAGRAWLKES